MLLSQWLPRSMIGAEMNPVVGDVDEDEVTDCFTAEDRESYSDSVAGCRCK